MGGTDSASGKNNGLRWSPQLLRACRPGIRPLFGQPLLLLAFVLVREVEAWSPLAGPLAVAVVLEAEGWLEAGVAQQSTCVLCVCCVCRPWQFMRTLWRLRYFVRPCLTDPDLFFWCTWNRMVVWCT